MKKFIISVLGIAISSYLYYKYQQKSDLEYYNKLVTQSITQDSSEEKEKFINQIKKIMQSAPGDLKWKKLYSTLLINYFKDYDGAISIMEEIYNQNKNNNTLIGICLLREKINFAYKQCYEKVLDNINIPYYNDINYWVAIGGLNKDYLLQDIERSTLPQESIFQFLSKDRKVLLDSMF